MSETGIKHITSENWNQVDPVFIYLGIAAPKDWIDRILREKLAPGVPAEVRKLFAEAQSLLIYGYFYYPLVTLGIQRLIQLHDAVVSHKFQLAGGPENINRMVDKINWLKENVVITEQTAALWHSKREQRNYAAHSGRQEIITLGMAMPALEAFVRDTNLLFEP